MHLNIKDLRKLDELEVIREADTWVALLAYDLVVRCS